MTIGSWWKIYALNRGIEDIRYAYLCTEDAKITLQSTKVKVAAIFVTPGFDLLTN